MELILGNCIDKLKELPDNSIDACVTDPPYGMSFMGKSWDKALPPQEIWKEVLRVLKPGAWAMVMCIPRQDCLSRMIISLADAGFDIDFTSIYWTYASGFPKAYNIANGIEGKLKVGSASWNEWKSLDGKKAKNNLGYSKLQHLQGYRDENYQGRERTVAVDLTTEEAKKFDGSYGGFQPKPAVEIIIVAMKPMTEKTFVGQVLDNGKGITWLDDCRIPHANENFDNVQGNPYLHKLNTQRKGETEEEWLSRGKNNPGQQEALEKLKTQGRFPANLLVSDDVLDDGRKYKSGAWCRYNEDTKFMKAGNEEDYTQWQEVNESPFGYSRFFSLDAWTERNLPFLICPKASKREKNGGLDEFDIIVDKSKVGVYQQCAVCGGWSVGTHDLCKCEKPEWKNGKQKNNHPTVKPIKLMSYLITMTTRPGDVVLDCFMGSGTTGCAAVLLDRNFVGIEMDADYMKIAEARIEYWSKKLEKQTDLFEGE